MRRLDPVDLVIADAERAVALAAIMGGLESEVGDGTTEVLLEAANFEPVGILQDVRAAGPAGRRARTAGRRGSTRIWPRRLRRSRPS